MRKAFYAALAATFLILILLAGGCSEKATAPERGTGSIQIDLMDSSVGFGKANDVLAVNVEIIGVAVHRAGAADSTSGWTTIRDDPVVVDLCSLTEDNAMVLADTDLPVGDYSQVRLLLGDANTVEAGGETHDLVVPSGAQTGLKLNHPFTISDDVLYAFTLDFDADRSVHRTGKGRYMLKPVIGLLVKESTGALEGVVMPQTVQAEVWAISETETAMVMTDGVDGRFHFPSLRAPAYDLHVVPLDAAYIDLHVSGIKVTAMRTTVIDALTLEIP